jgi:hypothetical protein
MAEAKDVLTGWIIEYVKSKDLLTRQITAIRQNEQNVDVVIEGTLKNQFVIIQPALGDLGKLAQLKDKHVVLVTVNTRENVDFLITHWDELARYPHLSIYFVNPHSSLDKRWVIFPATHDRITERKALRKGLESLYATVEQWKE